MRRPEENMGSIGSAGHLTDGAFSDLLLGAARPEVRAHLAVCAACSEEAQRVSGAVTSFERESRAWAERHAAGMPAASPRAVPLGWRLGWAGAWTTAAAMAILGAGVVANHWKDHGSAQSAFVVETQEETISPARLQADNELLAAVDGELRANSVSPPASAYGLDTPERDGEGEVTKRVAE